MATGGMEPEQPTRIRPQVVEDIVWVLEHGSGDVDVAALVLRLFDASDAEFALAFAIQKSGLICQVMRTSRRCGRRSRGCSSARCPTTRGSSMTRRRPASGHVALIPGG